MDFLNLSFNTVLTTNYIFLGLVIAMIAFIFLRRLFIYPIKHLEEERYDIYLKKVNKLLKTKEIKSSDIKKQLITKSHYDKTALEEVLLKKIDELYVGPSIRNQILALPQKNKLTFIFDESGLSDWRINQLKSPKVWTRRRVADILGRAGTRKAIVPFMIALRDKDADVRFICAKGLGKLKARRSIPFMISILDECTKEQSPVIADILINFGQFSIPSIISALKSQNKQTLYWLLRSLSEIEFPEGRNESSDIKNLKKRLLELLKSPNNKIRAYTAVCLGKLRMPNTFKYLCPLLEDSSPFVREKAIKALGYIDKEKCVAPLIKALGDKIWNVNYVASKALINFGPKITPKLKAHLKDANIMRRKRCAEILEEFDWILI